MSDSAGYIPVSPIRNSRHPPSSHPQGSSDYHASSYGGGGGVSAPGVELEQWRPELWDRDYSRRYRYNNTRVQRKCLRLIADIHCLLRVRVDCCERILIN